MLDISILYEHVWHCVWSLSIYMNAVKYNILQTKAYNIKPKGDIASSLLKLQFVIFFHTCQNSGNKEDQFLHHCHTPNTHCLKFLEYLWPRGHLISRDISTEFPPTARFWGWRWSLDADGRAVVMMTTQMSPIIVRDPRRRDRVMITVIGKKNSMVDRCRMQYD